MTDWRLTQIIEEFNDFKPPNNFGGGCRKSTSIIGFCVHFRSNGSIGKIEENCEAYESCKKGYKYNYITE